MAVTNSSLKDYLPLFGLLGLFLYLTRSSVLSAEAVQWLTDLSWTAFSALAAWACYQHAQKQVANLKQAWLFLSYAHISWFIGIGIWSYLELIAQRATPFPALSDFGFMLFAPLFMTGLYYFRETQERQFKSVQWAKIFVIATAVFVIHVYLFHERVLSGNESILYNIATLLYPVLYMTALIYGVLSFAHINNRISINVFILIMLGLAVHAVTDSLYAYSLLGQEYQVGSYLDVFWLLAFGLLYIAVKSDRKKPAEKGTIHRLIYIKSIDSLAVPILIALFVLVVVLNLGDLHKKHIDIYIYSLALLLVSVLVYQLTVARLESVLIKNLATSELLLEKSHGEIMRLARESAESLGQEIQKNRQKDYDLKKHHLILNTIKTVQDEYISGIARHEFFERLLITTLDLTNSEYGFIAEVCYKDNKPYLRTYALTNIAWDDETRNLFAENGISGLEFHNLDNLLGYSVKTKELVISNDPANDERSGGLPGGHPGLDAYLGVPLIANDKVVGVIGLANREGGYFEDEVNCWMPFFRTCASLVIANKVDVDRKVAEERLIEAKNEAEVANNAKSEFISRMSHELRTPLNAVIGFAQILEMDESLGEDQAESVSEIRIAGAHLLELIGDLLDVSRIEAGKMKYHFEEIPVINIIEASTHFVDKLAKDRKVSINYPEDCDCKVKGDMVRLKQVFTNLLSNAIKYNKTGGKIGIAIDMDENNYCVVKVSDTGLGIPDNEIEKLFVPFERLGAENKSIEGVGIGLYITKQIIAAHNGNITVDSKEGQGTTFTVSIPGI